MPSKVCLLLQCRTEDFHSKFVPHIAKQYYNLSQYPHPFLKQNNLDQFYKVDKEPINSIKSFNSSKDLLICLTRRDDCIDSIGIVEPKGSKCHVTKSSSKPVISYGSTQLFTKCENDRGYISEILKRGNIAVPPLCVSCNGQNISKEAFDNSQKQKIDNVESKGIFSSDCLKCKFVERHSKDCTCLTPTLHTYILSGHRCSSSCHQQVMSLTGQTKVRVRKAPNPRKISSVDVASHPTLMGENICNKGIGDGSFFLSANPRNYIRKPKIPHPLTVPNVATSISVDELLAISEDEDNDIEQVEPESVLLSQDECCDSIPKIMNIFSNDVEYVVVSDDTLNLHPASEPSEKLQVKLDSIFEKLEKEKETTNREVQKSKTKKRRKKSKSSTEQKRRRSTRNSSNFSFSSLCSSPQPKLTIKANTKMNNSKSSISKQLSCPPGVEQISDMSETNLTALSESLSMGLEGACTNTRPSIKDIFGDVEVKEEPLDLDDNMSVEAFRQELISGHDFIPKPVTPQLEENNTKDEYITGDLPSVPGQQCLESISVSESFHNLIKDEKIENESNSSNDSGSALQIDERLVPKKEEDGIDDVETGLEETDSKSCLTHLPTVNIISPIKIKILLTPNQNTNKKVNKLKIKYPTINTNGIMSPNQAEPIATHSENEKNVLLSEVELKCRYCLEEFKDFTCLSRHLDDHQKDGLIICHYCQKSFGDKTGMKRHMRTHTGEKPYECKVCGKCFSLPGNFKKHRDIHENRRTEPCEVCGKTFRRKEHLKYHMRTHTGEKPFQCHECGSSFTARYSLQIHMNIHLGKKPFKCTYCQKAFADKSTMRKHIRTHTGERPFHCECCGRSFSESGTLTAHMATHKVERPFHCRQCHMQFKTSSGLRQHEKVHTGEKQFACQYCSKRFLQKYNKEMHERTHTGERPHTCEQCNMRFRSKSCLAKHAVVHGGEEHKRYRCDHCTKKFHRKSHLIRHIDMHMGIKNHHCDTCGKGFGTKTTLKNHIRTFHVQGARHFPCHTCGRVFKRRVYVTTHECSGVTIKEEEDNEEDDAEEDEPIDSLHGGLGNERDYDGSSDGTEDIEEEEEFDEETSEEEEDCEELGEDKDETRGMCIIKEEIKKEKSEIWKHEASGTVQIEEQSSVERIGFEIDLTQVKVEDNEENIKVDQPEGYVLVNP